MIRYKYYLFFRKKIDFSHYPFICIGRKTYLPNSTKNFTNGMYIDIENKKYKVIIEKNKYEKLKNKNMKQKFSLKRNISCFINKNIKKFQNINRD